LLNDDDDDDNDDDYDDDGKRIKHERLYVAAICSEVRAILIFP